MDSHDSCHRGSRSMLLHSKPIASLQPLLHQIPPPIKGHRILVPFISDRENAGFFRAPKAPKKKKPKASKSSSAPSHPPYFQMIKDAILALNEKTGSSPYAIAKHMEEKHKGVLPANYKKVLATQLRNFTAKGKLVKVKASFKLSKTGKKEDKKKKKPTTKEKKQPAKETVSAPPVTRKARAAAAAAAPAPKKSPKPTKAKKPGVKKAKKASPAKPKQPKSIRSPAAKRAKKAAA